ncbi:hypothetical protein [Mycolicibacterium psychrotolerans]|uniref:Uncharacterized protein n=1 Tax=Mycolicibacterium psychrotolerans TaxID=216929 RepID=A0A7I7MEX9_9MYCO|nr:hypothetical protein [Mycolicibacterium psychrotolerans]BBX70093.1 hypothetical protein MPSYJ_35540 [Mycolicibacterium psychrotolerans]
MTDRLVHRCNVCTRTVADGTGYVHISHTEIYQHEQTRRDWRAQHAGDIYVSVADMPDDGPVRWRTHHTDCDPDPGGDDYVIPVVRMRTREELLSWTAHLLDKRWLYQTDWSQFIYSKISREEAATV